MTPQETANWQAAIADATDVRLINILIGIAKDQENREAAVMVAVKAKLMGYVANKATGKYEVPVVMKPVKGKNLRRVAWNEFGLIAEFNNGARWLYRRVPVEEYEKLLRVPFADKLFTTNIRGLYESEKM